MQLAMQGCRSSQILQIDTDHLYWPLALNFLCKESSKTKLESAYAVHNAACILCISSLQKAVDMLEAKMLLFGTAILDESRLTRQKLFCQAAERREYLPQQTEEKGLTLQARQHRI